MKYFLKKLLDMEYSGLWSPGLRKFFFEKFVKPSDPPPSYILNVPLFDLPITGTIEFESYK